MLRRIRVENFYSIGKELELSLLLNARTPEDFRSTSAADGGKVSKLAALVGPNGSGKTNLLKTLAFVQWFVCNSFRGLAPGERLPFHPHFATPDSPSEFEVEFELDGTVWRYHLRLTRQRVLHESLFRKVRRFVYVFKRDWDAAEGAYAVKLKEGFDLPMQEAKKVRANASLIATAAQYDEPLALELVNLNVTTNLTAMGRYSFSDADQVFSAAELYHHQSAVRQQMSDLLSDWDLGLDSTVVREQVVTDKTGDEKNIYVPMGRHRLGDDYHELVLLHESSGTRSAFVLLSKLLPVLHQGGLVVIDELESDLHPHMLSAVIDLFFSPTTNPHDAQIVFSTHSHEILNMLFKEQITLVEKDDQLNTDAYRLDDVAGVRADDNTYRKYMAGAYGAVPEL